MDRLTGAEEERAGDVSEAARENELRVDELRPRSRAVGTPELRASVGAVVAREEEHARDARERVGVRARGAGVELEELRPRRGAVGPPELPAMGRLFRREESVPATFVRKSGSELAGPGLSP